MKYNKVYRGQFANQERDPDTNLSEDVVIVVDIYDTTSGEADSPTEIIPLEMADEPVKIESIDNDEDKFTVIRGIKATIKIHSSNSIGIETFYEGGDTTYYAEIYSLASEYYFIKGFLSTGDLEEDFQPDPNEITLTVHDGLAFTTDEELTDEDGNIPTGVNNIWYYIRLALLKTGHSLDSFVVFNIREKFAATLNSLENIQGHFFNYCYLDAKTFEGDNPGTMITCREVLERILYGCFLTQYNGQWLIVSVDEMQGDSNYKLFSVDEDGAFSYSGGVDYIKEVGDSLSLSWMNDDTLVSSEQLLKRLDLKRNYEFFKEIPCNSEFQRGEVISAPDLTAENSTGTYQIECWNLVRNFDQPVNTTARLERKFEFGYEKERYVVIEPASSTATPWAYLRSEAINVAAFSKVNISFAWRFSSDFGAGEDNAVYQPVRLYIIADNGDTYAWWHPSSSDPKDYYWYGPLSEPGERSVPDRFNLDNTDESQWRTITIETREIPAKGKLFIGFNQMHQGEDSGDNQEAWFNSLRVEYIPKINGSFGIYTGETHTITQEANTKAKRENELFIGSGPDSNVKGVLQKRGANREIFAETVTFGNAHQFEVSGDHRALLSQYIGQTVIIAGSTLNDQETKLVSLNYSIIGDTTQVFFEGEAVIETDVAITLSVATFELAELFYAAQVLPDGPPEDAYSKPYGENMAFNIWNQYNRVMTKFEGTIDGLQTNIIFDDSPPHFIHKYRLTDANPNTGTRVFMLIHFNQDLHLCEWDSFLHEVHDPAKGKQYTGHTFKYLTE